MQILQIILLYILSLAATAFAFCIIGLGIDESTLRIHPGRRQTLTQNSITHEITPEQMQAISDYTDDGDWEVNAELRTQRGNIDTVQDDTIRKKATLINSGLNALMENGYKYPPHNGTGVLYRGQRLNKADFAALKEAELYQFDSFVSATDNLGVAKNFLKFGDDISRQFGGDMVNVFFKITVWKAADLRDVSLLDNESEKMLLPNNVYKVNGIFERFKIFKQNLTHFVVAMKQLNRDEIMALYQ